MTVVRLPRLLVIVNMITYELWMLWMLLMWRRLLFLLLSVLHQDDAELFLLAVDAADVEAVVVRAVSFFMTFPCLSQCSVRTVTTFQIKSNSRLHCVQSTHSINQTTYCGPTTAAHRDFDLRRVGRVQKC